MLEVRNPYTHELVQALAEPTLKDLDAAIEEARTAFAETRRLPSYRRSEILWGIRDRLSADRERFARRITAEAGKPIREARTEVARALLTLAVAAEEAKRIGGEVLPMDLAEIGEGRLGITRRFPVGPIGAITPFNFPLNLVLHKVGPAIAAGNPVILKPSPRTPLTALAVAELAAASGLPHRALHVLPGGADMAVAMAEDPRLKMLTFTGSAPVGWSLKARAAKKRVTLELGGNCGVIIHDDADLEYAAQRVVAGGFANAGQSCVSVQRVFVQARAYDDFLSRLLPKVEVLQLGDPLEETTDVGPMIDQPAAERAEAWVREALEAGARLLVGGRRDGSFFWPTVLADTAPQMNVNCQEVFAPLITVTIYEEFTDALARINDSAYGLQSGVFTRDAKRIFEAFETLETGGIMINDVPTYRVDHMPYGGMKDSGFGREGLRYAIEEMTELKIMVLNLR